MDSLIPVGEPLVPEIIAFERELFDSVCGILAAEHLAACRSLGYTLRVSLESCQYDEEDHFFDKINVPPPASPLGYRSCVRITLQLDGRDVSYGDLAGSVDITAVQIRPSVFGSGRVSFADRFCLRDTVSRAVSRLLEDMDLVADDLDPDSFSDFSPAPPIIERMLGVEPT
ncbi:MAG: hypothetical protein IJC18_02765 [Clostridia bacterium]|nr:hypothetical protein [Clostridia bacterium]